MATTAKTETKTEVTKVKLKIPKFPGRAEDDVIIGINGVNWQIPRGKEVEVPDYVAEEYNRSEAARDRYFDTQAGLRDK